MQPNFTHHRQKQAIAGGIPRQSAEDKRHCTGGINPSGQGTTSTSRREKFYVSASKVYSKVLFIYSEVLFLLYSPRHRTFLGVVWNFMHRDVHIPSRPCRHEGRTRVAAMPHSDASAQPPARTGMRHIGRGMVGRDTKKRGQPPLAAPAGLGLPPADYSALSV